MYTHFKRILEIEEKPVIKVIPRAARFPIIETCIRQWWRIKGMGKNRVYINSGYFSCSLRVDGGPRDWRVCQDPLSEPRP